MDRLRRCSKTLGILVAACLCVGVGTAMGHPVKTHLLDLPAAEAHALGHLERAELANTVGSLLWVALGVLAGAALIRASGGRARRRALTLGLALAVGVFTLETAVHAVHHLADPDAKAACPVLSGSQYLAWGEAQTADAQTPQLCASTVPVVRLADAPRWQIYRPHQGRAPPA